MPLIWKTTYTNFLKIKYYKWKTFSKLLLPSLCLCTSLSLQATVATEAAVIVGRPRLWWQVATTIAGSGCSCGQQATWSDNTVMAVTAPALGGGGMVPILGSGSAVRPTRRQIWHFIFPPFFPAKRYLHALSLCSLSPLYFSPLTFLLFSFTSSHTKPCYLF